MALQRLSLLCLCFLSAVVGLRAQAECDMIEASDLGSSTPSRNGFIADHLGGADAASRPDITVHNVAVISLAVGTERNMFRWASVFANYSCSGPICPDGEAYPRTDQFEVECTLPAGQSDPIWTDSNLLQEQRNTPVNPSLTSADLRRDCSFCVSPADGVNIEVPESIAIDPEFHCAACAASCRTGNAGLGYCTGFTAEVCCNVYQPNAMGVNICAVNCDMGYEADSPDFICERRCPALSPPTNGQVSHLTRTVGSVATYACGMFDIASGDATRTCQSNSTWDGTEAVCSDCPRLNNPENGMVTLSGLSMGSTASYTCNDGYFVNGAESRTCQGPGWSSSDPTCDACDTKYDDCKECTLDACTECNDGFELDAATGECNSDGTLDTSSGGKGCDGACVGGIIGGLLGAALLAAIVSAIIYGIYKYHTNPATQLKKSDTEGLNGVARDNPLYVDPAIVEAEVAGP